MTKRILTAILFLTIIISCVSCGKNSNVNSNNNSSELASSEPEKTVYQIFDEADKKMDALESYAYQDNTSLKIESNDIYVDMKTVSDIKTDTLNGQKRFTVDQNITVNDELSVANACYNGKYYVKQENGKYAEVSAKDYFAVFPDILNQDESKKGMPEITEEDVVSSAKGTYVNGTVASLTVKAEKFNTYLTEIFKDLGTTVDSVNIEDVKVDVKINNNGYFEELITTIKGHITITANGQTTTISLDTTTKQTIVNPGSPVTVTLPTLP